MKIAVPVVDKTLRMAHNAGHTPYFAVFTLSGGMFKTFTLEGLRPNPKMVGHDPREADDHHHECHHDHDDIEHIRAHDTMAHAIEDCRYVVIKMACKNTAKSMNALGIDLKKYNGSEFIASKILAELAPQFT